MVQKLGGISLSEGLFEENNNLEEEIRKHESELYGFEYEKEESSDEEEQVIEKPFDADKIRIDQRMLSLKYCIELLDKNDSGRIKLVLSPGFQRHLVWTDNKRKSLLIESLMLRIPIPAFYFYEDEDSIKYVIDGLQRLSTISEFLKGGFRLSGLQYLQETCGGRLFSELDYKYKARIYDTQLAVNIIDARTPAQVKYDIFRRINTGGVPLNAQEIRNAVAKPLFRSFLKRLAESEIFIKVTRGKIKDLRMSAQEMVLRFLAFYMEYDFDTKELNSYGGDLEAFLDEAFNELNKMSEKQLQTYEKPFIRAMRNSLALFGKDSFAKPKTRGLINKSLFTSWSVILTQENLDEKTLRKYSKLVLHKLEYEINNNQSYHYSLTTGTSSTKKVKNNFRVANKILEEVVINAQAVEHKKF